jgi:iron-sulfur cluster repair protein YtfE (RIC family)
VKAKGSTKKTKAAGARPTQNRRTRGGHAHPPRETRRQAIDSRRPPARWCAAPPEEPSSRSPSACGVTTIENDPIVLLEKDHRRFEELLKQGEETTERAAKRRRQLLDTLTRELNEHELMEEQVLYPALEPHAQAREIVLEGYEEHHIADVITRELRDVTPDDERWAAKFKVLKESLEHHIQEEERTMFRTARAVLSGDELSELGTRMKALKAESRG